MIKNNIVLNLTNKALDLQLLSYRDALTIKDQGGKKYIYDSIRKKYLILQPEELVRQLCIMWLIHSGIHRNNIQVEKSISINGLTRRFDIVIYDKDVKPFILVECKAPTININQSVFDQIASYQWSINAPYLLVTNGIVSFILQINHQNKSYIFFDQVPDWSSK